MKDLLCINEIIAGGSSTSKLGSMRVYFAYDEQGRVVGEYDQGGNPIQETVWFGNQPVATIKGPNIYYIHSDHLNTPRAITDNNNKAIWRWDSGPFGTTPANEDPDGDGMSFTYNLRFAGQYYDQESGLHYNYFRDYDPSTGRYITSDPIGIIGLMDELGLDFSPSDINLYVYVTNNPVNFIDPFGLFTGFPSGTPSGVRQGVANTVAGAQRYASCVSRCLGGVALGESATQAAQAGVSKGIKSIVDSTSSSEVAKFCKFSSKAVPILFIPSTAISIGAGLACFSECKK